MHMDELKEYLLSDIWPLAEKIAEYLRAQKAIDDAAVAGSIRRRSQTVRDIDIVVAGNDPAAAIQAAAEMPGVDSIIEKSPARVKARLTTGMPLEILVVPPENFIVALLLATGSKMHCEQLQNHASINNLTFSDFSGSEHDIYRQLKLQYIEPELREGLGEIEQAVKCKLPDLVAEQDIKGIFHVHTSYSDGGDSLSNMAAAAYNRGWSYMGIADHSKTAYYARGLKLPAIMAQRREIDSLNAKNSKFVILSGIESDILPDGSLDYDDDTLAQFDFVIASVHSAFRQGEAVMTKRIIKAISNKYVTMLGHPTGRLLLRRRSYAINLEEIINAAAVTGTIIEINSSPHRLDLDWSWCRKAQEQGVLLSVNPDAHSVEEFDYVRYGINTARKGWLSPEDILNTRPLTEVKKLLNRKRGK